MRWTYSLRALALGLLLALVAPSAACRRVSEAEQQPLTRLRGVYVNETGVLEFHFSDQRVRMAGGIADFDTSYEVEGNTLWISTADGGRKSMVIRDDGSLEGELGVFTKRK
jgi:hypothetical protein